MVYVVSNLHGTYTKFKQLVCTFGERYVLVGVLEVLFEEVQEGEVGGCEGHKLWILLPDLAEHFDCL